MKVDQNLLFLALELCDTDEEKFLMFYDINRTQNLDVPYCKYKTFDLDHLENDECVAEFRFQKDDTYDLPGVLQIPNEIVPYNKRYLLMIYMAKMSLEKTAGGLLMEQ